MTKITYENITLQRDHQVLSDFNLEIAANQFCVIVGPSGCGKSSLLELTAGLIENEAGSIKFNDQEITNLVPVKREIGYVFQEYALYPNMSVSQNIEFGLKLQKIPKKKRLSIINDILEVVNLAHKSASYPHALSGGEKQRVAIARSLVLNPKVLLMDEPLSSLDAHLRAKLGREIRQLHEKHQFTTIYVTHDQSEALALADQIVVMNQGEIMQVGSPREIYHNPANLFVINFFNSQHLNKLDQNTCDSFKIKYHILAQEILVRPRDIKLRAGNTWEITSIELQGELQYVYLRDQSNEIEQTIVVTLTSEQELELGMKYDLEITKTFQFDQSGLRLTK